MALPERWDISYKSEAPAQAFRRFLEGPGRQPVAPGAVPRLRESRPSARERFPAGFIHLPGLWMCIESSWKGSRGLREPFPTLRERIPGTRIVIRGLG